MPKEVDYLCKELWGLGLLAHVTKTVEIGYAELFRSNISCDFIKEKLKVLESKVEAALRNYIEHCSLVVAFSQTPEKPHNFIIKLVLF